MKTFTRILAVLWISLLLVSMSGCMSRAQSFRMLDQRSEYDDGKEGSVSNSQPSLQERGIEGFGNNPVPVRSRPKVASIWIHAHEMASRDYFWGGWMSVVVEPDQWVLSQPGGLPSAPGIQESAGIPARAKAQVPGARPKRLK